jgi:hypothetical protein
VQAQVTSVESESNLIVDSRVQNEGNGWAGSGANPWHLDADTESILFLTNESNQVAGIAAKVAANGVTYYLTRLKLNPHETRAIDIRKLRDAQQPDSMKNTIPPDAADGSFIWVRADNVPVAGRLAVISRRGGTAVSPECDICDCPDYYSYTTVVPATACPIAVGVTDQETADAWFVSPCGMGKYYSNITDASSWSSSNTYVFTLSSTGLLTAVGGGSANAIVQGPQECASWYVYDQSMCLCGAEVQAYGSAACPVWQPTYAVLTETGDWSSTTCSGTGIYRQYSAYDNFYHLITTSALQWTLHETVTSSSSCGMATDGTETVQNFIDYIANCDAGCTFTSTQWLTIVYNNHTWTLQVQDCVDSTFQTCKLHTGWNVTATTTPPYVTVTDY